MHSRRVLSFIPVAVLLTACTSTEPNLQHISLSLTIGGGFHASSIVADQIITGTSGSLRIASAELVLSHVKLASDTAGCAAESDDAVAGVQASVADDSTGHEDADSTEHEDGESDAECEPLHVGPVRVNLPLDGSTTVALDALVPAGTYTGVHAKLDSVNVTGVFTDAGGTDHSFTFAARVESQIKMEFATPVTVGSGTNNLTVNVDIGAWFKDAAGAIVDPSNPDNQFAIRQAIRASFHAFLDDDHDGADDHDEGGH
jgi:hypothetical protein